MVAFFCQNKHFTIDSHDYQMSILLVNKTKSGLNVKKLTNEKLVGILN